MTSIAFDLSALFVGAAGDTPRGIDRVDMGYAKQLFGGSTDNFGVLPSVRGMGTLSSLKTKRLANAVERHWREFGEAHEDEALTVWLRAWLAGEHPARPDRRRGSKGSARVALRLAGLGTRARPILWRPAARVLPQNSIYLNTGQVLLRYGAFFEWLDTRPDMKPVFLLHDLIPIFFPEYCGAQTPAHHARSVDTAARRAAAMIATSETVAGEIREAFKERGRSDVPIKIAALPVDEAFLAERSVPPYMSDAPYFVIVGAIDPRKNHQLLLNVWREMARALPPPRPKLVVVGARGPRSGPILEFIERSPPLQDCAIVINGLSTPAMRDLMRDARALLTPSFTEGYGLPIIEALALGTPVIASNIPAHREVGGFFATYLDPLDGPGWTSAIAGRAAESEAETAARRLALSAYRPQTWASYFETVLPFLHAL